MALKPDDTLLGGKYRIRQVLGKGGFGSVYLAQETTLDEKRAIKELIPALVHDEVVLKRFLTEAEATMRLTHEGIVRTYDLFREGESYYIAMEYLPGGSLEDRLQVQGTLPIGEATRIVAEVCEALSYAHRRGAVHCDLKPANILFAANGAAKVADFGIAHFSQEMLTHSWRTPAAFVAGTLPYMSPEQTEGVRDDARIDVYSLGAVLYRMLTGRTYLDFDERETPRAQAENVYRICTTQPAAPSTHRRDIPGWLDGVALKALEKQPERRHASVDELRAALSGPRPADSQALPTRRPTAAPTQPQRRPMLPPRVRPGVGIPGWVLWLAGGMVVGLVVVVALALLASRDNGGRFTPEPTGMPLAGAPTELAATAISALPSGPTDTPPATLESALPGVPLLSSPTPAEVVGHAVEAWVLPDNEPRDVAYDGSALWALYFGDVARLEAVASENRFREVERLPLDATDIAGAGSPGRFWALHGTPVDGTLRLALVDMDSGSTVEYPFPTSFDEYPDSLAWDGEFAWITTGGRLLKLRPPVGEGKVSVVDSYALDVGSVETPETGLTWDGEALWVLVWDELGRLDATARPTCMIKLSASYTEYHLFSGLAWDGRYLWATDFHTGKIYRADPASCQP